MLRTLPRSRSIVAGLVTAFSMLGAAHAAAPAGVPTPGPSLGGSAATSPAKTAPGAFRTLKWDELVPTGWDPMKDFKGMDFNLLSDSDPRAASMLKKLREAWDNAPTNPALEGQAVRIPGFVVPLEEGKDGLKEFLLVPYFGACIHSPPPPANQIIHVLPKSPVTGFRSMDAVWVSGALVAARSDTYMGAGGYRIEALKVEPYSEKTR
jgi:uncharacterized protein